jgi:predicted DNA-binding transcriptional regulator YafY
MPVNKNALIRYKTIDTCLRNRHRKWTLENLIEAVSEALYDYEGIDKGISRRSVQSDLHLMRSDKLGYNAPIIVVSKKYYTYEDPAYSITNIPLNEQDLGRMNEAVEILKQFKGFSHFSSLNEVVQKLEDHVYAAAHNSQTIIDFEKNERLKGLEHLEMLYQSVIQQKAMTITYQSFRAKEESSFVFHVWWLKEFKNRWFAVGVKDKGAKIMNLALDRIGNLLIAEEVLYIDNDEITPSEYYRDVVGVTVSNTLKASKVRLFVSNEHAPYVITKPMHHSQEIIETKEEGIIVGLKVQLNFELEREILSYAEGMKVLAPEHLRKRIHRKLQQGVYNYNDESGVVKVP